MSRIRSTGSKPEERMALLLQQALREELGRTPNVSRNDRTIPGTPDFAVKSIRLVVFVDGCFFHGCSLHGRLPESNREYWDQKIARNRARDRKNRRRLRQLGFSVWCFWEHRLKNANLPATISALRRSIRLAATRQKLARRKHPFGQSFSHDGTERP